MSISKMEKLTVILPRENADALLRALMRTRSVSLSPVTNAGEVETSLARTTDIAAARERLSKIEAVLPDLTRRSERKKGLFGNPTPVTPSLFLKEGRDKQAWETVDEAARLLDERARLRAELAATHEEREALLPIADLELPLGYSGTDTTAFLLGILPSGVRPALAEAALASVAAGFDVIGESKVGTYLAVYAHRREERAALAALAELGWTRLRYEGELRTARELAQKCEWHEAELEKKDGRVEEKLRHLATHLSDVEILWDLEKTTLLTEENKQSLLATDATAMFEGWCPVKSRERVTRILKRYDAAYDFAPPEEGDDPPILLSNNGFARNFEWVLGMYAYPKYGRYDPTFVMSIFYFIIFGLMFADAGYGLVLSLACFGAVALFKPREGMKRFLLMFGYCGISCIVCGVLFGAYFGNFPLAFMENVLKIPAEDLPNIALLFDPLQNPMGFLVVSLGVGAVHLVAGMAVKAVILCRDGHALDALFDIVTYWILFAGLGLLAFFPTAGLVVTLVGVASIVLTQGRQKKGVVMKFVGGLLGLYNLINYASDLLSYSRVLALGLAAGVIGQVVNILATLKGASFIGFVLMIVVFCVGHLLNLVINVLGTFVHTSRLQYIEFFGKFYEDGGAPFRPIAPSDRYSVEVLGDETLGEKQ